MSGPIPVFVALAALLVAGYALLGARAASSRARRCLATIDELITLFEQLADQSPAAAVPEAEGRADAETPGPPPQNPAAQGPPAPGDVERLPSPDRVEITSELRTLVPELYGQGVPVAEIARRSGLSRGEVKLLVALSERSRRSAG